MILICTPFNRISGRESEVMASIDEKRAANNELPELMNGYFQKFRLYETLRAGLFGKLQKVIQTEKETDAGFLKNLLSGPNDGTSWIDVQIISKYLDAKLTICHFHLSKSNEGLERTGSPQTMENNENDVTVIFNSRLCNDVELEVVNSIRIHAPWRRTSRSLNSFSKRILDAGRRKDICAMAFQPLRINGYEVSADLITRYSEGVQYFSSLSGRVKDAALNLYMASEMCIHPDDTGLEEINAWSSDHLKQELLDESNHTNSFGQSLRKEVDDSADAVLSEE